MFIHYKLRLTYNVSGPIGICLNALVNVVAVFRRRVVVPIEISLVIWHVFVVYLNLVNGRYDCNNIGMSYLGLFL